VRQGIRPWFLLLSRVTTMLVTLCRECPAFFDSMTLIAVVRPGVPDLVLSRRCRALLAGLCLQHHEKTQENMT